ncbi:Uncharacterised protein [Mycobacteroides abscessus subsp. abscessus]|nr:Uncharacterised protein [Mycobacteroides abscessus subsp. abscessus]
MLFDQDDAQLALLMQAAEGVDQAIDNDGRQAFEGFIQQQH